MDDSDRHLAQVTGAYNSTEQSTTGISPHMMLTGHEKALPLAFFYPEIRRQQDLNDLCRRNTQQAQIRQKRKIDERTADAKAYSVGDYVWVFQDVVPSKGTKTLLKKWRGPFQITEVHDRGRFYRLSTGRSAHYKNIKPRNDSLEDWYIPADMNEEDCLIVDPACELNERDHLDYSKGRPKQHQVHQSGQYRVQLGRSRWSFTRSRIQSRSAQFWAIDGDVDGYFCPGSGGRTHPHQKSDD